MKKRFQLFALLLAAVLLSACSESTNSFTWFVDAIPTNLDPQIASSNADLIACTNLYSGLLREDENGDLQNDLCESYTVSADGLTYTFTLKEGLVYNQRSTVSTEYILTASDFVFAFERIFSAQTNSPYTDVFSAIMNSANVLSGAYPASTLGVSAPNDSTVVFTLSYPDDNFLSALALPAASPCNEEFFESTGGTYGLSSSCVLSSGSFYLYNWTSTGLFLRRTPSGSLIDNLRLVENSDLTGMSAEELILAEKCTAALDDSATATTLNSISYSDTTWCLLYNMNTVLANEDLRKALSAVALQTDLPESNIFSTDIDGLIPSGIDVEGVDYREDAGNVMPSLPTASESFALALESLTVSEMQKITLLLPDTADVAAYATLLNSAWQKELSLFFSLEIVDEETFAARLLAEDYTLALAPVTINSTDLVSFLSSFSGGTVNYYNSEYSALLATANAADGADKRDALATAERTLLADCALTPLFSQEKRLLLASGVSHLVFDPYGPIIDATYAEKK